MDRLRERWLGRLILCTTSGLVLSLSQAPSDLGVLAIVALVPWLFATRRAGLIEAMALGVLTGLAFGISGCHWLFSAFEAQGTVGFRSILATVATVFWAKGLIFGAVGLVVRLARSSRVSFQVIAPALLFGLGELWMSESQWGLPVLLLGHSQLSLPGVAQIATVLGVPGLSAILLATNAATSQLFEERSRAWPLAAGLVASWAAMAIFGIQVATTIRPTGEAESKTLLVVQPENPRSRRWEPAFQNVILDDIAAHTAQALEEADKDPDLIVWPENLLTTPLSANKRLKRQFEEHVNQFGVPVVTGLVRPSERRGPGHYRNSVVWWDPDAGLIDAVDKARAMPLVESDRSFVGRDWLANIVGDPSRGPRVEEVTTSKALVGDFALLPALCFEVLFPNLIAERRLEDTVAIVNFADDSWVPGEVADAHLIAAAAFRAIEQRLTLIRISHGGLSVVIDAFGREVSAILPNTYGHLTVEVSAYPKPTRVEKMGILALPLTAGTIALLAAAWGIRRRELTQKLRGRSINQPRLDQSHSTRCWTFSISEWRRRILENAGHKSIGIPPR